MEYRDILKDKESEQKLRDDGFLVIKNFLDADAVNELLNYYNSHEFKIDRDTIFNTVWHTDDLDYKLKTINKIIAVYQPFCEKYFTDFKLFGGSFVVKPGNGTGTSHPHIDSATVDEEKYRSFSLWIPLIELTEQNGALQAVKGSHKFKNIFRGPNIPDQLIELRTWFWEHSKPILLSPGDVFIYDYRTVHCSAENFTSEPRVAVSCSLTNADANSLLYFWDETSKKVSAYEINLEMMLKNDAISAIPKIKTPIKNWDYSINQLTKKDFPFVEDAGKATLLSRLKILFS